MNKELLQQALDALLEYDYAKTDKADRLGSAAIYALRVAIAQPEQEGDAKDAKRLDWLQSQTEAYGFQDIHEGNRWMIDGPFMFVRDAIDAAIASQKGAV